MEPEGITKYLLVDTKVLPEAMTKVVYAKQLLAQGKAKSLSEATRLADISRSAFYKYKDHVFSYENQSARQIATITAELLDEPGVLSSLLGTISQMGGNILTINQSIPVDGVAPVSISLRCEEMEGTTDDFVQTLKRLEGVVRVRLLTTS